ncbi:reverse transcriptase [Cucumis melo var. makuwa]|uniref:Reverse transcriptase n=1 Tax=Cucumis melo var. makuwa TaxID=1194695 RepID=A0A5D3CBL7_CUCMM|nr:reverse transcriptase [Cucumis melo var. makuwa]TYK07709.1 reverse transcriptase [Cucumis melo var. makuwa]
MVSERSNSETLKKSLGNTQTKTEVVAVDVDTTMEKLLQRIQTPPIYPMGQPSPSSVQPSNQKPLHAPPLSGAWAHALPSVNLIAHPIRSYALSPVQLSHLFGHPPPHASPITVGQQPSKLSNLSVDPSQQPFFYKNGADQCHNRSGIETGESSAPSGYGQPYVCGLRTNQTYRRTAFEVGNQFSFVSTARNDNISRISVGNSTVGPQETSFPTLSSMLGQDLSLGRTIGTARLQGDCSPKLVRLHSSTKWSGRLKKSSPSGSSPFAYAFHFPSSYLLEDAILTTTHLINRMPSRILHLQTPLECLKESYPSTRLISKVPLRAFGCTAYVHNFGPNQTKFTPRAQAHVFVGYPLHQCGYKCFHPPRNLRKEVGSPTRQPLAPIQDFEPSRDQGMENPTKPCINNTMRENDKSNVDVLENVEEKNSSDETKVRTETSNNEAEQGHTGKLDKYDPSLDLPIALRKALEKNNTWEICALPKGHKSVGCKWVFTLKYKANRTLDRYKARVLSVAVNKDWPLYQLDVKNAFLNGDLVKEVYMSPCLTLKPSLVGRDDQADISQLKQRIARSKEGISVFQRKYTLDLLIERSMLGCCPANTPIEVNCELGNSDDQVLVDKEQYQRLVGKLIYLSHTHPDISFVVSDVSQFMQAPYEKHMETVKRILRYLKTTPIKGKSIFGYCTFVWGNLVTWRSKKQSVVARSSVEAEYRAMSLGICEEIWLQKVLSNLHQEYETPLKLFCDNKAAISIANNPV